MTALVDRYARLIVWKPDGGLAEAARVPSPFERGELSRRAALLTVAKQPASISMAAMQKLAQEVSQMFAGFFSARGSDLETAKKLTATYVLELRHLPLWAVQAACFKVRSGQAGINPDFPPSAARLCQLATEELSPLSIEASKIKAVLELRETPDELTPEERARVSAKMKELSAELRAGGSVGADEAKAARLRDVEERNHRMFLRDCKAAGVDPSRGVSPALLRTLGVIPREEPRAE